MSLNNVNEGPHSGKEKAFFYPLTPEYRVRVRIWTENGKVVDFVVQLETFFKGEWKAVVRYNTAHGFPHKDLIYPDGTEIKEDLPRLELSKIVVIAIKDLRENYKLYVGRLGYARSI